MSDRPWLDTSRDVEERVSLLLAEMTLAEKSFRPIAMSVFASGTIPPREAIEYVCGLPNLQSIVFGASSRQHIEHTREMICSRWDLRAFVARPAAVS